MRLRGRPRNCSGTVRYWPKVRRRTRRPKVADPGGRAPNSDEAGATLIELLVAIALLGVITVPLANIAVVYLRSSDATVARLAESSDAQLTNAYFGRDVASI